DGEVLGHLRGQGRVGEVDRNSDGHTNSMSSASVFPRGDDPPYPPMSFPAGLIAKTAIVSGLRGTTKYEAFTACGWPLGAPIKITSGERKAAIGMVIRVVIGRRAGLPRGWPGPALALARCRRRPRRGRQSPRRSR